MFSLLKSLLKERFSYLFFLMFSIVLLLNVNATVLRSVRNTLAVVALGSGSQSIPFFELFGALPGAFLMTWVLTKLLTRFSIQKVFFITLAFFIGFFLIFAIAFYPFLLTLKAAGGGLVLDFFSMVYYVMAELWKPGLIAILFWGLINRYTLALDAKKFYGPLLLGGSLGGIIAGPLVSFSSSETSWNLFALSKDRFTHSLSLMMVLISLIGALTGFLYYKLWRYFVLHAEAKKEAPTKQAVSLSESLSLCFKSPSLRLLSWIVMADYIAYSLGEVIFLDLLKTRFPEACDYCGFMGHLALWTGILTVVSALFITPFILKNSAWVVAALAMPVCLLVTEGTFFIFLRGGSMSSGWFGFSATEWLGLLVALGSLQYCFCRAAKYTLFDASKELVFVFMPSQEEKMQGKLVVDGICARLGRGSASLISMGLFALCGGVVASSVPAGLIALGMTGSWVSSTKKLGKLLEPNTKNIPPSTLPLA